MDTTLIAAVIGAVAAIAVAIIGIIATRRKNVDLRLVDVSLQESKNAHPKIEITLRNVGTEVIFLKRAEFKIIKMARLFPTERGQLAKDEEWMASFSDQYDLVLDYYDDAAPGKPFLGKTSWTAKLNLSRTIQPNSIDQFTIIVGEPVLGTTLYYLQLSLRYNDDDRLITSDKIIMALIGRPYFRRVIVPGTKVPDYDEQLVKTNRQIIQKFARLQGLWSEKARRVVHSGGYDIH